MKEELKKRLKEIHDLWNYVADHGDAATCSGVANAYRAIKRECESHGFIVIESDNGISLA